MIALHVHQRQYHQIPLCPRNGKEEKRRLLMGQLSRKMKRGRSMMHQTAPETGMRVRGMCLDGWKVIYYYPSLCTHVNVLYLFLANSPFVAPPPPPPEDRSTTPTQNEEARSDRSNPPNQVAQRSRWQAMLLEAGGLSAALSEENMRRLKYCLQWLQVCNFSIPLFRLTEVNSFPISMLLLISMHKSSSYVILRPTSNLFLLITWPIPVDLPSQRNICVNSRMCVATLCIPFGKW